MPGDSRTEKNGKVKKSEKKIRRLWKTLANVIPITTEALGPIVSLDEQMSMLDMGKREVDRVVFCSTALLKTS